MSKSRGLALLALLGGGFLVLPIAAYIAGGRVVGPYGGARGLASYLGSIYTDAASGQWPALLLLLSPGLIALCWLLRAQLHRRLGQQAGSAAAGHDDSRA